MTHSIYILAGLILLLGFILGRLFRKVGLTEVLAYLFAGFIVGPILHFDVPEYFGPITTSVTLALVGYIVGLTFSFEFLKVMGKKVLIILIVEVIITSLVVLVFVYLLTKNLPLSIILASLAPATAPAGTIAVLRDLKARGTLTNVSIAIVGLDDAAGIIIYAVGSAGTKMLLGGRMTLATSILHPTWEILGAVVLGLGIGLAVSYITRKIYIRPERILVIDLVIALLSWGFADLLGVSTILTCMIVGTVVINFSEHTGNRSRETIDRIMTPLFILFFAVIGMEIDFSRLSSLWALVIVYCIGRSVGKIIGCGLGGILSRSESKITKYLGIALLNQAGVAVGLAFLAAQELSKYGLGSTIITLMATTTALFQIFSPLGTQYAVKKSGEGKI